MAIFIRKMRNSIQVKIILRSITTIRMICLKIVRTHHKQIQEEKTQQVVTMMNKKLDQETRKKMRSLKMILTTRSLMMKMWTRPLERKPIQVMIHSWMMIKTSRKRKIKKTRKSQKSEEVISMRGAAFQASSGTNRKILLVQVSTPNRRIFHSKINDWWIYGTLPQWNASPLAAATWSRVSVSSASATASRRSGTSTRTA